MTLQTEWILAELDTIARCERAADIERENSRETRRILDEICAEVEEVVENFVTDLWDFGADFDAIENEWLA